MADENPAPVPPIAAETDTASSSEPSTALVPYDALQRQLADLQHELAVVRDMVKLLIDGNRQLALRLEQQPTPVAGTKVSWWKRFIRRS